MVYVFVKKELSCTKHSRILNILTTTTFNFSPLKDNLNQAGSCIVIEL